MTRYLLDTSIVSQATKLQPPPRLADWLGRQINADLFISTLTVGEIRRGILEKNPGRKRQELETWFGGPDGPLALFLGRVLPFDERAALEWARIMAEGTAVGRPRSALDMVIAATAAANQCAVVTVNERHFHGAIEVVNQLHTGRP